MGATFDSDFLNIFTSFYVFTRGKRKMVPQGSILGLCSLFTSMICEAFWNAAVRPSMQTTL